MKRTSFWKNARRLTLLLGFFMFGYALTLLVVWGTFATCFSIIENSDLNWWNCWWECAKQRDICRYAFITSALYVFFVTLFKWFHLWRLGADGVAVELGGTTVSAKNPVEMRFSEIVEETARELQARGYDVPLPSVYILREEEGINACAIGVGRKTPAIVATAGAIKALTREELRGVVAHEFGHLLNGDVKMNMRLVWTLSSWKLLTLNGLEWFREMEKKANEGKAQDGSDFMILALLLVFIGLPGFLLAKIVQGAISRPQEKLADKSAANFTNNSRALADALKKMGGSARGSAVVKPQALQTSHLFFGSIWADGSGRIFRTHPRLNARILALDPDFDGKFPTSVGEDAEARELREAAKTASPLAAPHFDVKTLAERLVASIGEASERLDGVQDAFGEIPEEIALTLRDFDGARFAVFALLLDRNDRVVRRRQLKMIRHSEEEAKSKNDANQVEACIEATARRFDGATFSTRAEIVRAAIEGLKLGTREEYERFALTTQRLCDADGRIDLLEFALRHSAIRELDVWFKKASAPLAKYGGFGGVNLSTQTALTYLAYVGANGNDEKAQRAFKIAVDALLTLGENAYKLELQRFEDVSWKNFQDAIERMTHTTPRVKGNLLTAFFHCVAADGLITEEEAEMFDAISLALGVSAPVWRSVFEANQAVNNCIAAD